MSVHNDTIFALATPNGRSGVAVIRVSGPAALKSLEYFLSEEDRKAIKPRFAYLASLFSPLIDRNVSHETSGKMIDKGLVIYFKAPNSFTGEDVIEFQLHGSPAVISELSRHLSQIEGYRPAERGEFTRRGFENGRMDLTEAEAVADLIDAETTAQKDQALSQMSGTLKNLYEGWAAELTKSLAFLEADLDFPDEDLPEGVAAQVLPKIQALKAEIEAHLNDNRRGERLRDGINIAVIGAPNAGKSSLVNALAQRDVAITSDFAGTTRDVLDVHLNIAGYPVILSDTAGLKPELLSGDAKNAQDYIESEGIKRAIKVAQQADIKLLVFEAHQPADEATKALIDEHSLIIHNKSDLADTHEDKNALYISVSENKGLGQLLAALEDKIKGLIGTSSAPTLTRERHRHQLQECMDSLDRALGAELPELMAEDIRLAVRALGRITGRVDVEDLLDLIFNEFCIGK